MAPEFLPPENAGFEVRDGVPVIVLAVDRLAGRRRASGSVFSRMTMLVIDGPGDAGFLLPRLGPHGDIAPAGWDERDGIVKDLLVDEAGIQAAFDEVFDQAIVFHGFADYLRDYDVFVYATADPRTGIARSTFGTGSSTAFTPRLRLHCRRSSG